MSGADLKIAPFSTLLYAILAQGSMLPTIGEEDDRDDLGLRHRLFLFIEELERSATASEEEEAVAKCALLRATTSEETELAESALGIARARSDELLRELENTYRDMVSIAFASPWPLCHLLRLLTRMRENKARREIEPF
jgi:hypothetical protein